MTAPTKAVPKAQTEWEEYLQTALATPEKFAAAVKDGDFKTKLDGYVKAYNEEQTAEMRDLKAQVTDQVTASVLEMFKDSGIKPDTARLNLAGRPEAYNALAPGAGNKVWNSAGIMLHDILSDSRRHTKEQSARMAQYAEFTNAYTGLVPSEGGYLIPEEVRADIMTRALPGAIVRPQATVLPMPTSKMKWPVNDFSTSVGSVFGGIVMSWVEEGQEIPDTEGAFASLSLNARKLAGLAELPNELVRFAAGLVVWAQTRLPEAWKHFEDLAFLGGDGVGKPLGGLHANNPSLIVVGDETGQSTATITWNNVLAMFARLLPDAYDGAEWDITPDAFVEIMTMALPVGTGGSAVMVPEGGGTERAPMRLLGLPIRWTDKTPALLGTAGDINLCDWRKYVVGDAQAMQIDSSAHSKFSSDKTQFRIIGHVDGHPGLLSPITPQNNGATLSAYIQLETRATD